MQNENQINVWGDLYAGKGNFINEKAGTNLPRLNE